MTSQREAVHRDPVWRDRSNFLVATSIDASGTDIATEQLWCRKIGERQFEICCIPFFAYDIALGDVVEVDDDLLVRRVLKRSGRYVFRVFLGHSPVSREEIAEELESVEALLEWSSPNLLAVDASDLTHATTVANLLQEREERGDLVYETGRTR